MFRHVVVAAFLLVALAAASSFADVAGPASVIDGDTLVVAGERIRFEGIDAPELHHDCTAEGTLIENGIERPRGRARAKTLKGFRAQAVFATVPGGEQG